jgi:hypothetical protein
MDGVADPGEVVDVDLTDEERFMLNRGLVEWGGPARCARGMQRPEVPDHRTTLS